MKRLAALLLIVCAAPDCLPWCGCSHERRVQGTGKADRTPTRQERMEGY